MPRESGTSASSEPDEAPRRDPARDPKAPDEREGRDERQGDEAFQFTDWALI